MIRVLRLALIVTFCSVCSLADVTYTQTMKFTGGSMVEMMRRMAENPVMGRMGGGALRNAFQDQTSTIYLKGSKMARVGDNTITIFDLDAGTMTVIRNDQRTYTVETFDQMREQMEKMQQRMNRGQGGDVAFDVKVDNTGQTRTIEGKTANETVMTLTAKSQSGNGATGQMVVKVDAWLVPADSTTREVADFSKRLADKFSYAFASPAMGAAGAGISAAMRESSKLDGFAVLTGTEVSGIVSPMAAMNGGGNSSGPALQIETRSSNVVSGPVDDSKFTIPAGYKQEQPRRR